MKKNDNRGHIMMRYGVIILFILVFAVLIVTKLVNTTVIDAKAWNDKANIELQSVDTIIPERGNILAADGSILATNLRYYTLRLDYRAEKFDSARLVTAMDTICDSLAARFKDHTPREWRAMLTKPFSKPKSKRPRAMRLLTGLSYTDVEWVRTLPFFSYRNANKNGLVQESYLRRANPYGTMASRSIGGVGEQKATRQVRGISGLELALDTLLYGKPGLSKRVPLTKGIVNWTDIPARPGYDIKTTIDINIQDIVENELNDALTFCDADWGVAVLMEVKTGDIKAISNLQKSEKGNYYVEAINRAVQRYEPGSVVKTLSMMIALEDGIISGPDDPVEAPLEFVYAGRKITDSHFVGSTTAAGVIEQSSNVGMTKIIIRKYDKDPAAFVRRVRETGFLDPMHTGIAGELTPRFDPNPSRLALSRMCYGYSTEITPMATLALYNAIANNGHYVRPRLYTEIIGEGLDTVMPVTYIREQVCSERNAKILRDMLTRVVWGDHGTARHAVRDDNVRIAGKTGTCYMIERETGQYNKSKKRLTFCGFFPADNPKYSCIVLTANPKQNAFGAPSTSGRTLRNIASKLFSRGLLDNRSDYNTVSNPGTRPTFYATSSEKAHSKIRAELALDGNHVLRTPSPSAKGVPDVKGLGLREAIAKLERAGYNVKFSGTGFVASQSPGAGIAARRGATVTLALSN